MPTYADIWNEQQRALGQSGPSNPVRLTISKGDYVWDAQLNRFRYDEQWEEEHLMEDEDLYDDNYLTAPASNSDVDSRGPSPPPLSALQPTNLHGTAEGLSHQPSLWVLDTNTLMSCLELLKALFAALLTRNVAYAGASREQHQHAASPTRPSPIKLVIPYVVVSELDGLKVTRRKDDSVDPSLLTQGKPTTGCSPPYRSRSACPSTSPELICQKTFGHSLSSHHLITNDPGDSETGKLQLDG